MKSIFFKIILLGSIWGISGCSSVDTVLDDISRDTYESKVIKAHRIDNIGNPTPIDQEPLSYDQYQKERRKMISGDEDTLPDTSEKDELND